jgi:hypothetical protein
MRRMVVDSKLLGNQPGDSPAGPNGALKAKGCGPLAQQGVQLRQLHSTQARRAAGRGMRPPGGGATRRPAVQPLAHGGLTHPQCRSDLLLGPALLGQFARPLASPFAPSPGGFGRYGIHASSRAYSRARL